MSDLSCRSSLSRRYMSSSSSSTSLSVSSWQSDDGVEAAGVLEPPSSSAGRSPNAGLPASRHSILEAAAVQSPLPERAPPLEPCATISSMQCWAAMSCAMASMSPEEGSRAVNLAEHDAGASSSGSGQAAAGSAAFLALFALGGPSGRAGGGMAELPVPSALPCGDCFSQSLKAASFRSRSSRAAAIASCCLRCRRHGGRGAPSLLLGRPVFSRSARLSCARGVWRISWSRRRRVSSCMRTACAMSFAEILRPW
mmetsp:Transcript_125063/g.365270  ORF Transcript_125063/g.365270 Transcript_125063/m.365270 type:complete len:254 (+) Transcript_125063:333-1094(+)